MICFDRVAIFNFLLSVTRAVVFFGLELLFNLILNTIFVCGRSERHCMLKYALVFLDLNSARRFVFFMVSRSVFHFFFVGSDNTMCYTQEGKEIHPKRGRWMGFHLGVVQEIILKADGVLFVANLEAS